MAKNIKIKPGKTQSMFGFIVGLVFCGIGIFVVIPTFGPFGIFWALIAIGITVVNGMNAFGSKGVSMYEVSIDDDNISETIEDRLKKLDSLYHQNLITKEEYYKKREDILKEI